MIKRTVKKETSIKGSKLAENLKPVLQKGKRSALNPDKISNEKVSGEELFDPYQIIKSPLSTEKSIRQIEFDNKLMFVVHSRATKLDVKKAVEILFKVKVSKINIHNSFKGEKRAYVKLSPESLASDVSAELGLI